MTFIDLLKSLLVLCIMLAGVAWVVSVGLFAITSCIREAFRACVGRLAMARLHPRVRKTT